MISNAYVDRRRDLRHRVALGGAIVQRLERLALTTEDVSYRGLLVRTPRPVPLGALLRIEVAPPEMTPFTLHGIPVRSAAWTEDGRDVAERVGVALLETVARWERFIDELQAASVSKIRLRAELRAALRKVDAD